MKLPLTQLQIFLQSRGWSKSSDSKFSEHLVFFSNPQHPGRELTLPTTEYAPDYEDAVLVLFSKLASIEKRPTELLAQEAATAQTGHLPDTSDDLILRIVRPTKNGEAIPLTLARTALIETEVNLPLLDVPLSHSIMRPLIAVPRSSFSQTALG